FRTSKCRANMRDRGLAGCGIQRRQLDDNFRARTVQELIDRIDMRAERRLQWKTALVESGSVPRRLNGDDSKRKRFMLRGQQPRERSSDVSVAEQCQLQKSVFSMSEPSSDSNVVLLRRSWLCRSRRLARRVSAEASCFAYCWTISC